MRVGLRFLDGSRSWSVAGLAAGSHEKKAQKPERSRCRTNFRLSSPTHSRTSH
jgi:hypothetical protein